ncbi:hypothetical protein CDD82_6685 [Ophiocordyceps australis]|uniref:Rit1 DUSP-like domain-containing protein n=1 Tax=Ophiocordyceps australis TaxID=1399860 RepID=A0A2C5YR03_9HYPO|nr:hypothetical protein CDD82_6685 [Ophiocordyceps australis]
MTVEQRRSGMTLEQRISILTLDHNQQQAATPAFVRSEPYSYKRPSQPYIDVPTRLIDSEPGAPLELSPIVTADLSSSDAALFKRVIQEDITRHGKIVAEQQKGKWQAGWRYNDSWVYALRYKAQCVLDHLWIGPLSVVRDVEFLRREGFSMVLVARDERLANTRLPTLHEACRVLDLASRCFAIDCKGRGLVGQLAGIMDAIKTHVVAVERRRGTHESSRRAKILIVCNTGNELAPGIAAAYLMAVFGQTLTQAFETVMTARYSYGRGAHGGGGGGEWAAAAE